MITLRELAIVDLSYRVAHVVSDKKLVHYVFRTPYLGSVTNIKDLAKDILAKRLNDEIEIEPSYPFHTVSNAGASMKVESLMDLVTPYTKNMLRNKVYNSVHEYNIAVYPLDMTTRAGRLKDKALRMLLTVYWKLCHAHIVKGDIMGIRIRRHFGFMPQGLFEKIVNFCEKWTELLYCRRFAPISYFAVRCRESEIKQAVEKLEKQLWYFQESILGCLSPIIKIELADNVGDGEKRCVALVYPVLKSDTARLLEDLLSSTDHAKFLKEFSFADEGGNDMKWVSKETDYEIERVEINLDCSGIEIASPKSEIIAETINEAWRKG